MCPYNRDDPGAVLRTKTSFRLEDNLISHSHTLSVLPKEGSGDVYNGNLLHDTPLGQASADWTDDTNRIADAGQMRDVLVMCRRWTHPDLINLHSAVPRN